MEINNKWLVLLLLRIGIAAVFLYAALGATFQPDNWIGYIPPFVNMFFPAKQLLIGFSFFQFLLCIWILTGWQGFYAGLVAAITLLAIIIANLSGLDIVFRDIAIFFAALALMIAQYSSSEKEVKKK